MNFGLTFVRLPRYTVVVWLHLEDDPPADEWNLAIQRVRQVKRELGNDLTKLRSLIVSDGGAPNAKQRTELFSDVLGANSSPSAVVSCALLSPLKRGIATALSWLNTEFRAMGPDRARFAFTHIRCESPEERDLIWQGLVSLQRDLPPAKTLALMAEQLGYPVPQAKKQAFSG